MTAIDALRRRTWRMPPLPLTLRSSASTSAASRSATWALVTLAALAAWFVSFALGFSALYEAHAQHALYQDFRLQLASGTAPIGGVVAPGSPVALLDAPAAGVHSVVVVEGTSSTELRSGPGHYPGGPLPGQPGVSVVMGRSTTFGGPFSHIDQLKAGDAITAVTAEGSFHYHVEDVRRPGDPFPPALRSGSQLTLVTADDGGWRSGWAPSHAVFVDAVLDGRTAGGIGTAGVPSVADTPLHGDSRGWYPLILWLQLLLIGVGGGLWAATRWSRARAWVAAAPVALAGLWGASLCAFQLLPNLM